MSQPQAMPEIADTGPEIFTADDVERLHRRLRDNAPLEARRRLVNASLEDGALIGYFETSTEPSPEKTYPGIRAEISYLD